MKVVIYSSDKFPLSRFVSLITCTLLDVLLVCLSKKKCQTEKFKTTLQTADTVLTSLDSSELAELGTSKISGVVLTRVHQKRELKYFSIGGTN